MDIQSLSMNMAYSQLQTDMGTALLSKSLDMSSIMGDSISNMIDASTMEQSVSPYLGGNFDMSV